MNKIFESGQTLKASELNEIVNEVNFKVNQQVGTNLINPAELETSKAISLSGSIVSGLSATYVLSGYIPVKGKDIIASAFFSSGNWSAANVYNSSKEFLRTIGATQQYIYQEGDAYIRFSFNDASTARANYGSVLQPYEVYNPVGGYIPDLSPVSKFDYTINGMTVTKTSTANANTAFNLSVKDDRFVGNQLFFRVTTDSEALVGKEFSVYIVVNGSYISKGRAVANSAPIEVNVPQNASSTLIIQTSAKDWTTSVSAKFEVSIKGLTQKIEGISGLVENISTLDTILGLYNRKNIIHVGKGYDYEEIQQAINSVTDASEFNQYLILVHDDYSINSVGQLWKLSNPILHAEANNLTYSSAYIVGKNWVNIMGADRIVTVSVKLPEADSASAQYDYCNVLYSQGNMKMANIRFEVENTRYAYHEENGRGSVDGSNANTRKYFKNCEFIYLKGARYNSAAGIGTAPGAYNTYENCIFYSAVNNGTNNIHSHPNYDYPFTYEFINCRISSLNGSSGGGYCDIGSGVTQNFIFMGCDFGAFNLSDEPVALNGVTEQSKAMDVRCGGVILSGHGNTGYLGTYEPLCLYAETTDDNKTINIIDDTAANPNSAYTAMFGAALDIYAGTPDAPGVYIGSQRITNAAGKVTSLANRLGDCSSINKTLTLSVDGTEQTLILDRDYRARSSDDILADLNRLLTGCIIKINPRLKRLTFSDTAVYVKNNGNTTIHLNNCVTLNGYMQVKQANVGDKLYGVAAERINPNEMGLVIVKGGQYLLLDTAVQGKYYTAGDNGSIVESDKEGELYGIGNHLLKWV
jgi:hypothetical protein